ncbi:MAG: 23S rRNA (pseudouridine(1915)-N(3))-methyltransferase RlmH [Candidatus Jorgensenbacteria bacterium]|nr:23S rRNA (pseudouridine(1915)-N(3))-methyltransferase RlmH [Candidatus Jorgensenbacteria bacterium]
MFNLTIIAVGGIRNSYFKEAVNEYLKRIKPFAKVEIIEVAATPFKSDGEITRAKEKEGDLIISVIEKKQGDVFILDELGKELNSEEFSNFITTRNKQIIFVIGGTAGLSDKLKKGYKSISLSRLTMPHELVRVLLLEQVYRSVTMQQKRNKYNY